MIREVLRSLAACVVTFVVCAVLYPALVWGLGQLAFPNQAEGSLARGRDRTVIGSELIAQPFASDRYFWPRPSAAGPNGYAADAASGSNLGTKNPALVQRIKVDMAKQVLQRTGNADLKAELDRLTTMQNDLQAKNALAVKTDADTKAIAELEPRVASASDEVARHASEILAAKEVVPVDLVTTSGSGLDPDISPEAAAFQADRVAKARGLALTAVNDLIREHTNTSGALLGAPPRVNVLKLNLALDKLGGASVAPTSE